MTTQLLSDLHGIQTAAALLAAGELVAFPTETVYGLGANARSDSAVQKIYAAKGRPSGNPLIVHVATAEEARQHAAHWPDTAEQLAEKFWPGPLTLILSRGPHLSPLVSAGRDTVALRVPAHPIAQQLLRAFSGPIAAPSANRSGFTSPTSAQHVLAELAGRIPLILDGGECAIGLESTVLFLSRSPDNTPVILRPGSVTFEMIRTILPNVTLTNHIVDTNSSALSPGQHSRHYAPQTPAYRFRASDFPKAQAFATTHSPAALITWSTDITLPPPHVTLRLPPDEQSYARQLYAALRDADTLGGQTILVLEPPRNAGLGAAIADRLRRATQPLPD